MAQAKIRQPIVTVAGHVDHGKTSILDAIRQTKVAEKEAGAITQKISFSIVPKEFIEKKCQALLKKFNVSINVPGFLFIDTPGHAAFTNLRQRGGNIADLAILVIDINEGIKEQTRETIEILKKNKTPFFVALNKIDKITGWKSYDRPIFESINLQQEYTISEFHNKALNIITALSIIGFEADFYWQISDFTKKLALVPCSAKTHEGIDEILIVIAGLAQKYLAKQLALGKEAKGNVLEVVKEKGITYYDCILCDGELSKNDLLLIASFEQPIVARIRGLFEALPLNKGFKASDKVTAATGFRVLLTIPEGSAVYAGMPFIAFKEEEAEEAVESRKEEMMQLVQDITRTDKTGVVAKAESLGSLEALVKLLRSSGIGVKSMGIGDITKADFVNARAMLQENPLDAVILGFNVGIGEAVEVDKDIKVFTHNIIYRLIEEFLAWREEKRIELERKKLAELVFPAKIKVLRGMVFRQSKPAICGIKVLEGTLKRGVALMNVDGERVCSIKSMQSEGKAIEEAKRNDEVAIAMPEITLGRQVKEDEILYTDLSEDDYKKLKQNESLLTATELQALKEIVEIKRRKKLTWGI
jgi:translation initiation factor 5B